MSEINFDATITDKIWISKCAATTRSHRICIFTSWLQHSNKINKESVFANQIEVRAWCPSQWLPSTDQPMEPSAAQLSARRLPLQSSCN